MKKMFLSGLLIVSVHTLHAQIPTLGNIYLTSNIDSLKATLSHKKGIERILTLLSLERSIGFWNDAPNYGTLVTQIQKELNTYPQAQGHYRYFKAKAEADKGTPEAVFEDSKKAYEIYKSQGDSVGMVSALLNMGQYNRTISKVSKSVRLGRDYIQEAMKLTQHSSQIELQILYSYTFVLSVPKEVFAKKKQELQRELQKALKLIQQHPYYSPYAPYLLNLLAFIYESTQEYAKAQEINLAAIDIYKKNGRVVPVPLLNNLGFFYELQHKYKEAISAYQQALQANSLKKAPIFKMSMDISAGIHASLIGLKKYQEAAAWADSIYFYGEKYAIATAQTKLQNAVVSYEVEKKEATNKILQQEKEIVEARSKLYITLGIVVLAALIGVSFLLYRLRQNNTKLQTAYNEILQLNQARDYFFGVIAHDLRRPLSSFQDIANLLKYYLDNQRYDDLKKVSQSIDQMGMRVRILLDNLLAWALSQREEVPHYPERVQLGEKIRGIVDLYQPIANYQKIEIKTEYNDDFLAYIDPNACDLIIRNLVDNAIKHSRPGGEITIRVAKASTAGYVNLSVEDNGKGMSEEKVVAIRKTLQSPVLRSDRARGMGMIMIGRFLKSNGIGIEVKSTPSIGTAFNMSIPMG